MRAVPKGRSGVVPQTLHLRDLQGSHLNGASEIGSHGPDFGGNGLDATCATMHASQHWRLAQHGRNSEHSAAQRTQRGGTQRAQHGMRGTAFSATSNLAQSKGTSVMFVKHQVAHAAPRPSADDHDFELYHHSQKLTMQLPAGFVTHQPSVQPPSHSLDDSAIAAEGVYVSSSGNVDMAAADKGLVLTQGPADLLFSDNGIDRFIRAESPNDGQFASQGSYSMQWPALDSDAAGTAAAGAGDSQGSYSVPALAMNDPLMHRSSSVRFIVDRDLTPDSDADCNLDGSTEGHTSQRSSPSPSHTHQTDAAVNADSANLIESEDCSDAASSTPAESVSAAQRTMTLLSNASSLKSVLKQTLSDSSRAGVPGRGSSRLVQSPSGVSSSRLVQSPSGVSFALDADESSTVGGALLKQGSESFPSWLTEGYVAAS